MTKDLNPDTVVVEFKSLVYGLAVKYRNSGLDKEDLVQEGMLGLLEACKRFDASRNLQFSTYATYWIKKYILLAISREHKHSLNVSSEQLHELPDTNAAPPQTKIEQADISFKQIVTQDIPDLENRILTLSYKQNKTIKEIAAELNLSQEKIKQIRSKAMRRLKSKNPQG